MKLLPVMILLLSSMVVFADTTVETDVELLNKAMAELHPGYDRYRSAEEMDSSYKQLLEFARTKPSRLKLFAEVQRYLSQLRCDHTVAELPKDLRQQKQQRFSPFHLRVFNDRLYISHAITPLKRGDEVLSVNGYSDEEILSKLSHYVSYDGYTSHVIADKIASNSDVLGSYFEILFAPVVMQQDDYPETLEVKVRQQVDNIESTYQLDTVSMKTWQEISGEPFRQNFKDAVHVDYVGKTAILTVDTFVNYREPVDAKRKFNGIFKDFKKRDIKHLIVDLRKNGGGSDDAQFALLTHLTQQPIKINTRAWIKGNKHKAWQDKLSTWDKSIFKIDYAVLKVHPDGYELPVSLMGPNYQDANPAKNRFQGPITLLTSKHNSSAAAAALGILAEQTHVTTLGEETGGNLGGTTASIITFLKLPTSGITARVPLIRNEYNLNKVMDGYGLKPDIKIEQSLTDWLSGKDTILIS